MKKGVETAVDGLTTCEECLGFVETGCILKMLRPMINCVDWDGIEERIWMRDSGVCDG